MKISLTNISKSYRSGEGSELNIIDNLSAVFQSGESISIRGSSGVGKSTLLHIIAGLDEFDSGSITCGETSISSLNPDQLADFRKKHVGLIFQFHHLLPEFTALENIALPFILAKMPDDKAYAQAEKILDRVGLIKRKEHLPSMLSGGEQQRIAIARAVVNSPDIILADEPTGNLDPNTSSEITKLLLELQQECSSTLITVTHDVAFAQMMSIQYILKSDGLVKA